jgi:hypothetical protein
MLRIEIINDRTGTEKIGNYYYRVYVNHKVIDQGRIKDHIREYGWVALVRRLLEDVENEENK